MRECYEAFVIYQVCAGRGRARRKQRGGCEARLWWQPTAAAPPRPPRRALPRLALLDRLSFPRGPAAPAHPLAP